MKKIKNRYYVIIFLSLAYIFFINYPIIRYNCDKTEANKIISKEEIVLTSKWLYDEFIILKPLVIEVSNPDPDTDTVELLFKPIFDINAYVLFYRPDGAYDGYVYNGFIN